MNWAGEAASGEGQGSRRNAGAASRTTFQSVAPAAAAHRGYSKSNLVCCLCSLSFPAAELTDHMEDCRRRRTKQYQLLPSPYDESEVLRPTVLMARNLLPRIPGSKADKAEVANFNKQALVVFRAQALGCEECGRTFPPNAFDAFRSHVVSCDGANGLSDPNYANQENNFMGFKRQPPPVNAPQIPVDGSIHDSQAVERERRRALEVNELLQAERQHLREEQSRRKRADADKGTAEQDRRELVVRVQNSDFRASKAEEKTKQLVAEIEDIQKQNYAKLDAQVQQIARLQQELNFSQGEAARSHHDLETLRAALAALKIEQEDRLESERASQAMEREGSATQITELQDRIAELEHQREEMQDTVADLEQRLAVSQAEGARLRHELMEQDRVVADAIARNEQLEKQRSELEIKKESAEVDIARLEKEAVAAAELVERLHYDLARSRQATEDAMCSGAAKQRELTAEFEATLHENRRFSEEQQRSLEEAERLHQKRVALLEKQSGDLREEKRVAEQKLREASRAVDLAKKGEEAEKGEKRRAHQRSIDAENLVERATKQLEFERQKAAEYRNQAEKIRQESGRMELQMNKQIGSLEARLEDARESLEEERKRARDEADRAADREEEVREELAATRDDHLRRMEEIQAAASRAQKEARHDIEEVHNEMERAQEMLMSKAAEDISVREKAGEYHTA